MHDIGTSLVAQLVKKKKKKKNLPAILCRIIVGDPPTLLFLPPTKVGDFGSIPGSGTSPEEVIGYSLQYSWISNSGPEGKVFTSIEADLGLILGLGRSPGGGHGNPLQDSCLENPMDRRAWWAIVHGVTKSQT